MVKIPDRKSNPTKADSLELISCIPNMMRYIGDCVSDGHEGTVKVNIIANNSGKQWGVTFNFPINHLQEIERIESNDLFSDPRDVRDMLEQNVIRDKDDNVIVRVDVGSIEYGDVDE